MSTPQHVTLIIGRFIVLVVAIRKKVVILWATWDGGTTKYHIRDLENCIEGPLLIYGYSNYLCILCVFKREFAKRLDANLPLLTSQDSELVQDKEDINVPQIAEENVGAIIIDLALLICGNNWDNVCFNSKLACIGELASVWSIASFEEQLFILTTCSIIQCSMVSVGDKRRLVAQDIHSHFLHDILSSPNSDLGSRNNLHMSIHVDKIGDVFVAIYDSFLYIQRLSEGNTTFYYDSTKDSNWQKVFMRYKRLSILKVEKFYSCDLEDQNMKTPTYYYLIVGSPGLITYMTLSVTDTTFVTLLEIPLTTRSEYTGCVWCADNLLLLNHRQQKVFCAKRVKLKSESTHSIPTFVEAPVAVPEILNSDSVIFRLDLIDFNPNTFPLSVLLSYNGDGITCHCIDPATDVVSQQLHSFFPICKSFLFHNNRARGPVYELQDNQQLEQSTGQLIGIAFSRYHLFRRLEFYWDSVLDGTLCNILPIVINYYEKDTEIAEKKTHLPILPISIIENVKKGHNSIINFHEKLTTRLRASSYIYDDYLVTIHSATEAHEFASPLLRQWLYSYKSSDFGPLFAAAYYLLTTNIRTGNQHWLPLPFSLPHLQFEITSTHIAESDYMGKRVPEISIIICSFTVHSNSALLCRCIFKGGRSSLLTGGLDNLVLSITSLKDILNRIHPSQQFMTIHVGSNSSYVFVTPECCAIELYHDLSDGGASYEEIRPLKHCLRGGIYKQICVSLICQLPGDYERTLTPTESSLFTEKKSNTLRKSSQLYLTIGGNPNPRISILNGTRGRRFYCIVFIGEKKMFGSSAPLLSTDRSLAMKNILKEELKWYQLVSRLDDSVPLTLGLILISYSSRKIARIYKFPVLAHLQKGVSTLDRECSVYDYLDAIITPLARNDAYIGLVNLSTTNTMNDWVLVCILEKHICVYNVPLGTILTLEPANASLGPILGVQGFAWLNGAAVYIHGHHSSQLVFLMQKPGMINKI